jgi:hypothetical protein
MESDKALGYLALGWLIGAVLLMARTIRRGRELANLLALRHPESYEALGRPKPGFFHSVRGRRFAQFVARREFEDLDDPTLSAQFDEYRKHEARLLWFLLASLLFVFILILAVRHGF